MRMLVGKTRLIDGCDGFGERVVCLFKQPEAEKKPESGGVSGSVEKRSRVGLSWAGRELLCENSLEYPVGSGRGGCFQGGFEAPERLFGGAQNSQNQVGFRVRRRREAALAFLGALCEK